MSEQSEIPIWKTILEGWKAAFSGLKAMPAVMLIALAASAIGAFFHVYFIEIDPPQVMTIRTLLKTILLMILGAILFAPAGVALHRYILSGDVTGSYFRDIAHPRVWTFVLVGIFVGLIPLLPSAIMATGANLFAILLGGAVLIGGIYLVIRLSLMAPMAALDGSPFGNLAQAFEATGGKFWRIFGVMLFGVSPFIIMGITIGLIKPGQQLGMALFTSASGFFQWLISVALISIIYSKLVLNKSTDAPV